MAGDSIGLSQTALFSGAGAKNVGTGKAIQVSGITLTGLDAANYSLTANTASTTGGITPKALALTGLTGVSAVNRVYDGTLAVSVTVTSSGTIAVNPADVVAGDDVSVVAPTAGITTGTLLNKNAGLGKALVVDGLALSGADAGNYTVSATNGVTVDISQRALTATYTGVDKVYDGSAAATVIGSSAGIVAGDGLTISGSGVFSAGKNAGTGLQIAVTAGALSGVDAANYTLSNTTGSATANITPKVVTVAYLGGTRVYDGTTLAPVTGTLGGLIGGDTVVLDQSAVFSGAGAKNVGTNKSVAVTGINLSGADALNYSLLTTAAATTASIIPRPLGIIGLTGVSAADRVYDGTNLVAVTVSTTGTVTPNPADLIAGDVVTITAPPTGLTTGTMADKNVGSNKPVAVAGLTIGGADAGNYSVASTSGVSVNITPKSLTANYAGVSRVYDGTTAVSIIGSSADIIAGDSVLINGNGIFGGTGARNAGIGKTVDVLSAALSSTDAGNYTLLNPTATTTADITPRPVTATYDGGTRVYDGTVLAPITRSITGFITGDLVSLSETALFTGAGAKNIGVDKAVQISGISLSGGDAANYALVATIANTMATVTPRPLNVTGLSGVTAIDRAYDGTTGVQVNVSGTLGSASGDLIPGDDVTVNVPGSGISGGTMADKHVGQNKAVALTGLSLSGADAPNYAITGTAGLTVNISPLNLTANYTGVGRVYDGTAVATVIGDSSDIVAGDNLLINAVGVFTGTNARNVGTAKTIDVQSASLAGTDAGNYALVNATGSASADITPRPVSASYLGGTRVYDGTTTAAVTRTVTGFISGDAVSLSESAIFTGAGAKNVGTGKAIAVSAMTLSGDDAANYSLLTSSASTTGTITPRPLNVTGLTGITATDRVYDGTVNVQVDVSAATGSAGIDIIAGDSVSLNLPGGGLTGGTLLDKNAGQNKPVVLSGLTLSGADAPNYAITGTAGVSVNIAPRNVTLSGVNAVDRVYDGSTVIAISTSGGTITGALAGDDLQLLNSGSTGSIADKHVGQAKAVNYGGLTLGGADAGNYLVVGASGLTVNITPRTLVLGMSVADKSYDGNTGATITLVDDRVAGDALTVAAGSAQFADRNAGSNIAVTVSGLAASGADAQNYQLSTTSLSGSANINRAALSVTANSLTKIYGDTLNLGGSDFSVLGLVAGETLGQITLSSSGTAAGASVAASPYTINVNAAAGGSYNPLNYDLTLNNGQLVVAPRPLTIASNSVVRFADEPNPSSFGFSTSVGGLVGTDAIASVVQAAPAGSVNAPGGSVFELLPSGAVFASGNAANYALSYSSGLMLVLPVPPRIGDGNTGSAGSGNVNFAIQISPAEVARAMAGLERASSANEDDTRARTLRLPLPQVLAQATPAEIAQLLSADGARFTLPELVKMPLISFDPQLRRLISAAGTAP